MRAAALIAGLGLLAAGCGAEPPAAGERSGRLVDFSKKPPYVNALEIDPRDGSFLLTTNRGFYRVPAEGGEPRRIRSRVMDPSGTSPVGTFLELDVTDEGDMLASGHPDRPRPLPPYLGLMRSDDGGLTFEVVSRLGEADLHQIRRVHDRLYGFDAVLGAILVSEDEGRTWTERPTPRQLVLDFVVDPRNPDVLVASTEEQLYRSEDGGKTWRPQSQGAAPRLDWPAGEVLMRADGDGRFLVSADAGRTWEERGTIAGEPYKVLAQDADRAYVALSDGSILETTDGGRTFADRFRP